MHEVLRSPGEPLDNAAPAFMEARVGHDFSRVRVHTDRRVRNDGPMAEAIHLNAMQDDEATEARLSEDSKPGAVTEQIPTAVLGEDPQPLQSGGKTQAKCPTKTVVEKTTDMTPHGINKGYRTGYGACAVMRVEPDSTDWDGARIIESNKQTKNTCPTEFGISPCSGRDTFTIGVESNSSILGKLPATRNHFYDYHTTRWNRGSLLHDRNPKDVDSCEVVCEQNYSCDGKVIGTHVVTRTFTKGTSGSRNVTLVAVTKK